jgi:hypothetical protein
MGKNKRVVYRDRSSECGPGVEVCVLCGGPALIPTRVMIGNQFGWESTGIICELCRQVMVEECPICQGEEEG